MDLYFGNGLFCRVVAGLVLGKSSERNAEIGRVCTCDPAAEDDAARKHEHCCDEGTEKVEHHDS